MTEYFIPPVVAEIINDFNRIAFSHDLFSRIIGVSYDKQLVIPYKAVFRLSSIPRYEVLKALNIRFNYVVVNIMSEADVVIEVGDDVLPF